MKYNLRFYRKHRVGEIISILDQDVMSIQTLFMNVFNDILTNIITFIGLTFMLLFLNWKITIITFCISIFYLFFQRKFGNDIKKITYKISVKRGENQSLSQEIIENISNIQLYSQEYFFSQMYKKNQEEFYNNQFKGTKVRARSYILDGAFEGVNLVLILFLGGIMVFLNDLTIGSLFTLTLYIQKLFKPIITMINDYMEIKKAQASIDRVNEILECKEDQIEFGEITCKSIGEIKIKDLSFGYNGKNLINNFSLEIKKGQKIAILGENGCGKSTLMNLILKLENYTQGDIIIDEKRISDYDKTYYDKILLIRQKPFIFNGSILDNIKMGNNCDEDKIKNALSLVNLDYDISKMEKGINTLIGEKGINLSGGQAQKLSLARIFLYDDNRIIILDEPTSSLDLESEHIFLENLFRLKHDNTIIIITHRREVLNYCNKIIDLGILF